MYRYYTLDVFDSNYILSIVLMFVIAVTINYYTVTLRRKAIRACYTEQLIARLHSLSRQLATTRGVDKLLHIGVEYISESLGCAVQAMLQDKDGLVARAKSETDCILDAKDMSVA